MSEDEPLLAPSCHIVTEVDQAARDRLDEKAGGISEMINPALVWFDRQARLLVAYQGAYLTAVGHFLDLCFPRPFDSSEGQRSMGETTRTK